jgi:hypothetical protein
MNHRTLSILGQIARLAQESFSLAKEDVAAQPSGAYHVIAIGISRSELEPAAGAGVSPDY